MRKLPIALSCLVLMAPPAEPAVASAYRTDCIIGPRRTTRVGRLPATSVISEEPRNRLEDSRPHCSELDGYTNATMSSGDPARDLARLADLLSLPFLAQNIAAVCSNKGKMAGGYGGTARAMT